MVNFKVVSDDLIKRLDLKYLPVGVTLYNMDQPLPTDIPFTEEKLKSYCQALALAGQGRSFLLRKDKMGCTLGTSVLGFEEKADDLLDDGVFEKYEAGLLHCSGMQNRKNDVVL